MLARKNLSITEVRLKIGESWAPSAACLSFVFVTDGYGFLHPDCLVHQPGDGGESGKTNGKPISAKFSQPEDHSTALQAGDVLVLSGRFPGSLCPKVSMAEFAFSSFTLCMEQLFPVFAGREIAQLETVKAVFTGAKTYSAGSRIARECHELLTNDTSRSDFEHRCHLLRVASCVIGEELRLARPRRSGTLNSQEHMEKVLESISLSEFLHASVASLARRFACTCRHLNRLFHQQFGCSVAALKMEMRLVKAASLLSNPSAKIAQVAGECGFNYIGQFNERFKKRFGVSPSEWRQSYPDLIRLPTPALEVPQECGIGRLGLCPWHSIKDVTESPAETELFETPVMDAVAAPLGDKLWCQ